MAIYSQLSLAKNVEMVTYNKLSLAKIDKLDIFLFRVSFPIYPQTFKQWRIYMKNVVLSICFSFFSKNW